MSDATVTTETPQNQPGPSREPDGTIKDQSPPPSTTPTSTEPTTTKPTEPSTEGDGTSFLTGKAKPEGETAPPEKKDGEGEPEKKDETAAGAPEKYGDFKLPDGYKFDEAELGKAQALFKEMNLTQDQAQKLVDHYSANNLQAAEAPYKAWADLQKSWLSDIGDRFGSKADSVRTEIGKAITSALPPSLARSFRAALDLTGAGSNPDIVEGLHIMLRGLAEGGSIRQGSPSPLGQKAPGSTERPSIAEAMYPHLIPNRNS